MNVLEYVVKITDNASKVFKQLAGDTTALNTRMSNTATLCDNLGAKFLKFNEIRAAISGVSDAISTITGPAIQFETNMKELEAVTGVTGAALADISAKARLPPPQTS